MSWNRTCSCGDLTLALIDKDMERAARHVAFWGSTRLVAEPPRWGVRDNFRRTRQCEEALVAKFATALAPYLKYRAQGNVVPLSEIFLLKFWLPFPDFTGRAMQDQRLSYLAVL